MPGAAAPAPWRRETRTNSPTQPEPSPEEDDDAWLPPPRAGGVAVCHPQARSFVVHLVWLEALHSERLGSWTGVPKCGAGPKGNRYWAPVRPNVLLHVADDLCRACREHARGCPRCASLLARIEDERRRRREGGHGR